MPLRLLIILSLGLLAGMAARAQIESAENFFNSGAQFYISNNIPAALERTESGLKLYPGDPKLKKLEELLKQQQHQQNQKNNQSKQNQQSHPPQQSQNKQNKRQENKSQAPNKPAQPKQEQQQQQQQAREKQGHQKKEDHQQGAQMSPQEARRLLDSQKENAQFLQLKPKGPPPANPPKEDW